MLYGIWYGLERAVVEGLRTDSLYIGDTTLRVSQLLSMIIVVLFAIAFGVCYAKYKKGTLWDCLKLDNEKQTEDKISEKVEIENGTDN